MAVAETTIGTIHGSSRSTLKTARPGKSAWSSSAIPRPTAQLPKTPDHGVQTA